jgi:ABC-type nitrate/sulfonate/bicarbonate transport system substrate-binding protein
MKLKIVTMGLAALVAGVAILGFCSTATAQEKVNLQMDWIFSGKHAPFFVARDKGFFKKNGLEVNMIKGRGSGWAATSVDAKQADYSYGDFPTALKAMAKGGKNRAIGVNMIFQGGGLIFLDSSGIKTPKDLEGKRFGASEDHETFCANSCLLPGQDRFYIGRARFKHSPYANHCRAAGEESQQSLFQGHGNRYLRPCASDPRGAD